MSAIETRVQDTRIEFGQIRDPQTPAVEQVAFVIPTHRTITIFDSTEVPQVPVLHQAEDINIKNNQKAEEQEQLKLGIGGSPNTDPDQMVLYFAVDHQIGFAESARNGRARLQKTPPFRKR